MQRQVTGGNVEGSGNPRPQGLESILMQHLPFCMGAEDSKMNQAESHNGFREREKLQHRREVGGMRRAQSTALSP